MKMNFNIFSLKLLLSISETIYYSTSGDGVAFSLRLIFEFVWRLVLIGLPSTAVGGRPYF